MILISAGHGGRDAGSVNAQYTEANLATDLRNIVAFYLEQSGKPFITDGRGKENLPLNQAIALAKRADIAVEIHFNASTSNQAKGVEVLANEKDKKIAQALAKAVADVTGSPLRGDNGYKPENSGQHSRLGFVQAGGLILEVEFISNTEALQTYLLRKWLVGKAIAQVLLGELK